MTKVCILGMGFVGLTLGAVLAEHQHEIIGVDTNEAIVEKLRKNKSHFHEEGLDELLEKNKERISFYKEIPKKADVYIISVGTPLDSEKKVRMDYIQSAAKMISEHLEGKELIILRSTVKIGTSREIIKPILDKTGKEYYLAFCPERTIEGKAVKELTELPQIIGGINSKSTEKAEEFFRTITKEIIKLDTIEEAEMVKLLNNSYRDLTFAFANEAAIICNNLGVDAGKVIKAANQKYARSNIPMPGFVGGLCLTKDSHILAQSAIDYPLKMKLVELSRKVNEQLPLEISKRVRKMISKDNIIFFSGLAFKGRPETDDTRNSPSIDLIDDLKKNGFTKIYCHDFAVKSEEIEKLELAAITFEEGLKKANCIIIGNNNTKYSTPEIQKLVDSIEFKKIIFDPWRNFEEKLKNKKNIDYETI